MTVTVVGVSGWLYKTDRYWSVEWVETLDHWSTNGFWALVGLHVAGVLYTSLRHHKTWSLRWRTDAKGCARRERAPE